jgi:hypothetical protein
VQSKINEKEGSLSRETTFILFLVIRFRLGDCIKSRFASIGARRHDCNSLEELDGMKANAGIRFAGWLLTPRLSCSRWQRQRAKPAMMTAVSGGGGADALDVGL